MVMQFGQFLDHDMTLTPEQGWLQLKKLQICQFFLDRDCCHSETLVKDLQVPENLRYCLNINTENDSFYSGKTGCIPFTRSDAVCTNSKVREQFNAITGHNPICFKPWFYLNNQHGVSTPQM